MDATAEIIETLHKHIADLQRILDRIETGQSVMHATRDGETVDTTAQTTAQTTAETIARYRNLIVENRDVIARIGGATVPGPANSVLGPPAAALLVPPAAALLELPGSDARFESEFETGRSDGLSFRAPADRGGVAVYGPYIGLPAGHYRFEMMLEIRERAPGMVTIDLCDLLAERKYYSRTCFGWELEAGRVAVAYDFPHPVEDLEMRLLVPPAFSGAIRQLKVSRWTARQPA